MKSRTIICLILMFVAAFWLGVGYIIYLLLW